MKAISKLLAVLLPMAVGVGAQEGEKPAPAPEPAKPPVESPKETAKTAEPKGNPIPGVAVGGASRARRKKDVSPKVSEAFLNAVKEKGASPIVKILIVVDEEGRAADVKVGEGSGFPEFDEAALEAALQTFSPKMVDGKPVKDTVRIA